MKKQFEYTESGIEIQQMNIAEPITTWAEQIEQLMGITGKYRKGIERVSAHVSWSEDIDDEVGDLLCRNWNEEQMRGKSFASRVLCGQGGWEIVIWRFDERSDYLLFRTAEKAWLKERGQQ